jgi:hypothetical protein
MKLFLIFRNFFKSWENIAISDQLVVLKNYPILFSVEEGIKVVDPVTLAEILTTLKGFKASKSPGPDGWSVEFFLVFLIFWEKIS